MGIEAKVKVPGTCGELVQGIKEDRNFHITCPVNLFSYVRVRLDEIPSQVERSFVRPKAFQAMEETLKFFHNEDLAVKISISSQIPIEKGMASSTADIVGTCVSITTLLGERISSEKVARLALSIEPTDGVMFKGIVCFDHLEGKILEFLGNPPKMRILVIDLGSCINTLEFHKRVDLAELYLEVQDQSLEALELVKRGIREQDINLIGEGATISALANQKILFKPELTRVISISRAMGAVGVNVAHSGTVMGVLLPPDFSQWETLKQSLQRGLGRKLTFYETSLIEGGWSIEVFSRR